MALNFKSTNYAFNGIILIAEFLIITVMAVFRKKLL